MKLIAVIISTLFLITGWADVVLGQVNKHWRVIGEFTMPSHDPDALGNTQGSSGWGITCVHFLDELHGIVGTGSFRVAPYLSPEIRVTSDGGRTWAMATTPATGNDNYIGYEMWSVWMRNPNEGWAVVLQYGNPKTYVLWHTTDAGLSWTEARRTEWPEMGYSRVKQLPNGTLLYGADIAIVNALTAATVHHDEHGLSGVRLTTDGGATWQHFENSNAEFPSVYYQQSSGKLFAIPSQNNPDNKFRVGYIYWSSDNGRTWNQEQQYPSSRCIDGGADAIYIQGGFSDLASGDGFLRSLDEGKTFKNVEGPNRRYYTRFHVPPTCSGGLVVGFDSNKVWMTTTGGDGTLITIHPPILSVTKEQPTTSCDSLKLTLNLDNIQCRKYVFTSARLEKAEGVFSFDSSGVFPITLPHAGHGKLDIYFFPDGRTGFFEDSVRLYGYEETLYGKRYFDTVVYINSSSLAVPPRLTADKASAEFLATSTCQTRDTTFTLTNTGCDTLTIDNVATGGAAYSFNSISTPLRLAPGASLTVTVTFHPPTQGQHFGAVELTASQQGLTRKLDIPLSGSGVWGEGLLELQSSSEVKLPEFSICAAGDDTLATLRNTGCDTIIVANVNVSGASDYALASAVNNVVLPPDSSLSFRVTFTPQDKGSRNGTVAITWTDERGSNSKDIQISLNATVIDGTRTLGTSHTTLDFGETSICEERDTTVWLKNTGCDTLTISDADIDRNFMVGGDLPITLAPGDSIELLVTTRLDTIGNPRTLTGVLTVTSNADNQLAPITLSRRLFYPTKLRVEAVDEASGKAGDEAKFRIILEGDVPARMTALHFDFLHNNDLLSFESLDGAGLTITQTQGEPDQRQSFTLSPVHAGVLGELRFKAYLAEAEQTTLSFDNIRFDAEGVSFAPECIAVISDSGTRFNYVYECGDDMIRSALRGETLIKSLTPNPATNEIRLELADGAGEAEVVIVDMLGKEVLRTSTRDRIDVSGLISGTYYLRVSAMGSVQTRRVIIER